MFERATHCGQMPVTVKNPLFVQVLVTLSGEI